MSRQLKLVIIILLTFVLSEYLIPVKSMEGNATYYSLNGLTTACGLNYTDVDLVGAVASSYWTTPYSTNDPICQKSATVIDPSTEKSVVVQIRDKCGGCKADDIDLSPAAFEKLEIIGVGRFFVNWNFN